MITDYSELIAKISGIVNQQLLALKITGASIALIDDQTVAWSQGFGFADKENGIKASPETIYKIGSITKVFTGTAIMQLAEQGKLNIDHPVKEYIPEFAVKSRFGDTHPITIRSLMTHHSGLSADNLAGYFDDDDDAFKSVVDYLRTQYVAFPQNYVFSYSNLATDLLGVIISRTSGIEYWRYIEQNILRPLEMDHSFAKTVKDRPNLAKAYDNCDSPGMIELFLRDKPAGCMDSTAIDISHFVSMLFAGGKFKQKTIIKTETLAEMFTIQNGDIPLDFNFKIGLNWFLSRSGLENAGKVCWHDGGSPHYFSIIVILPEQKLGVVIMTNSASGMMFTQMMADEILQQAVSVKTNSKPSSDQEFQHIKNELLLGAYGTLKGVIEISESNTVIMSGTEFKLISDADGWYQITGLPTLRLNTTRIKGMDILALEQSVGKTRFQTALGTCLLKNPVPKPWRQMTGVYSPFGEAESSIQSIKVTYQANILVMNIQARKIGQMQTILDVVSDNEAIVQGLGRFAGETIYRNSNAELKIFGLTFRRSES
jgi:CubicO group peptidase (beta-lactamase class C family)